ncbi:MAG: hypothetical protein ABII71_03180 [Candidatus Micrarchaeota archaeon]
MELSFPQAFLLTLVLETSVIYILLRRRYEAKDIVLNSALANTMTHPLVWFLFPAMGLGYGMQAISSELFAFLAEAVILSSMFRNMSLKEGAVLSLAANAVSFATGLLFWLVL